MKHCTSVRSLVTFACFSVLIKHFTKAVPTGSRHTRTLNIEPLMPNMTSSDDSTELNTDFTYAGQQAALLDYEEARTLQQLDYTADPEPSPAVDIPVNVYEVDLRKWTEEPEEGQSNGQAEERLPENNLRTLLRDARQNQNSNDHQPGNNIRHSHHHGLHRAVNHLRNAVGSRAQADEQVINLPVENLNEELLRILQARSGRQDPTPSSSLNLLRERERFNVTVDYQEPFRNIEARKLLEIVLLMRSDCTLLPSTIVHWVSDKRGILFECRNGAWVVRYLKRRTGKPKVTAIKDCHEIHMLGELNDLIRRNQVIITYDDNERKTFNVLCKHNEDHTNHDLIDNRISLITEQNPRQITVAGAWTVVQRRVNGSLRFYRQMKRYKKGFSSWDDGEYWIGLDALHEITHSRNYMLRVEITTNDNKTYFSEYKYFKVANEAKNYKLRLGEFITPTENTEQSAGDIMGLHNRGDFHAKDSNNFSVNCGNLYGTGFWFRGCWATVNINGPYITEQGNSGVRWATNNPDEMRRVWKTEMLMQPVL